MIFARKEFQLRDENKLAQGKQCLYTTEAKSAGSPTRGPTVTGMTASWRIYELSQTQKSGKLVQSNDRVARIPRLHLTVLEITGKTPTFQILIFSGGVTALCGTLHGRTEHYQASAVRSTSKQSDLFAKEDGEKRKNIGRDGRERMIQGRFGWKQAKY